MLSPNANKVVESFLEDSIPLEHFLLEWTTWGSEDQYQAFTKLATTDETKCIQVHPYMKSRIVEIVEAVLKGGKK